MNFINALFRTSKENFFVFHFMNYFSRFFVTVIISIANVEDVIFALKYVFNVYQKFMKIYCDEEQHFYNEKFKEWLKNQKIKLILSSFELFQSIELINDENKFLKSILRKFNEKWNQILKQFINKLNSQIIEHLKLSLTNILMKFRSSVFAIDFTLLFFSNLSHFEKILHQLS